MTKKAARTFFSRAASRKTDSIGRAPASRQIRFILLQHVQGQTYLIDSANFIACHKQEYVHQYSVAAGLKKGGTFLLNTQWTTLEQLEEHLPAKFKRQLAGKEVKFYVINAVDEPSCPTSPRRPPAPRRPSASTRRGTARGFAANSG